VFVVSWANPDSSFADKTMDDYLRQGILEPLDAIKSATGERDVTAIGYCVGGTLMSAALAYMASKRDRRIKAVTFFAAQVDFSEAGNLRVFIDEKQLADLDRRMEDTGYLDADAMYSAFNMLRANDLIWTFYVDNYLLGKKPLHFDLLYWNGDATRMPRALHMYYLREMYLKNNLVKPNALTIAGEPIELSRIHVPLYQVASEDDHIAPWRQTFRISGYVTGPKRFVLSSSGHILGIVNPPVKPPKRRYCVGPAHRGEAADAWHATAEAHDGSWWEDWDTWLAEHCGAPAALPPLVTAAFPKLADAPGTYVLER
jgi:polyhydroxyalkanoate synthase